MMRTKALLFAAFTASLATAQWNPYNTGLQSIRSITTLDNAIYVAAYPTGVHKSTNEGLSWTPVNTGLPVASGNIFVQSVGRNATHLFAGTQNGIYRSSDAGSTWTLANSLSGGGSMTASGTVFANKFFTFGNTTYAVFQGLISAGGGIYTTTNNGTNWLTGHSGMSANMRVYHITQDGQDIYAGTNIGIYRSTAGANWVPVGSGVNFDIFAIQKVGNRIHIIGSNGYQYSDNGGMNWSNATGGVATPTKGELIAYNGNLYALTGTSSGCLRSTNNGVSYSAFNTGLAPVDVVSNEEFHASPTTLYMGALTDLYSIPGSTVDLADAEASVPPLPYPTAFEDGFTIDLSGQPANSTVLLIDASGREVRRINGLPSAPVRIERGTLVAGRYLCQLIDPTSGLQRSLGQVIAQ